MKKLREVSVLRVDPTNESVDVHAEGEGLVAQAGTFRGKGGVVQTVWFTSNLIRQLTHTRAHTHKQKIARTQTYTNINTRRGRELKLVTHLD